LKKKTKKKATREAEIEKADKRAADFRALSTTKADKANANFAAWQGERDKVVAVGIPSVHQKQIDDSENAFHKGSLALIWNEVLSGAAGSPEDDASGEPLPRLLVSSDISARIQNAQYGHEMECQATAELMIKSEKEKLAAELNKNDAIERADSFFQHEMQYFETVLATLLAIDGENAFHIKRGTYMKEAITLPEREVDVEEKQKVDHETRVSGKLIEETAAFVELIEAVKALHLAYQEFNSHTDSEKREYDGIIDELTKIDENYKEKHQLFVDEAADIKRIRLDMLKEISILRQYQRE